LKEIDEDRWGFVSPKEKLLCLVVLDDAYVSALTNKKAEGKAFFRAFITENRSTGAVQMKMRFRYKDGDQWYKVAPRDGERSRAVIVAELQEGMENVLREATLALWNVPLPKSAIETHWPPNEKDDGSDTLAWLLEKDLVYIAGTETL
jgi:hypothetical protein